jgi:hypothetical protein
MDRENKVGNEQCEVKKHRTVEEVIGFISGELG